MPRNTGNANLQFMGYFMGCCLVIRIVLSGNFDVILGEFIPKWVPLYFYSKLISAINPIPKTSILKQQSTVTL
jgi:hypothetical protein